MKPGFYDIPDKIYHKDPWGKDNPALSASLAKTILQKSLQNAWVRSPHCPAYQPIKPNEAIEAGLKERADEEVAA